MYISALQHEEDKQASTGLVGFNGFCFDTGDTAGMTPPMGRCNRGKHYPLALLREKTARSREDHQRNTAKIKILGQVHSPHLQKAVQPRKRADAKKCSAA